MRRFLVLCALFTAMLLHTGGCASITDSFHAITGTKPDNDIATIDHNPLSLQNYQVARGYAAQGRYELAKEHYLLAYAAAGHDPILQENLRQELHSVDLMIKTMR